MRAIEKNSLIVSCQASQSDPLYGSEIMAKMALAAQIGGARGIRADSPEDVQAIKKIVNLTVIGIWKCDLVGYDVYITPTFDHAKAILESGADYVAIDCTNRKRPEDLADIFIKIRKEFPNRGIVADIATKYDAQKIIKLRPDFIATTMSGYTSESENSLAPDYQLIRDIKEITKIPILAEGHYQSGLQVAKGLKLGAYAVVIGSAITRPQNITRNICDDIIKNLYSLSGAQ